MPDWKVLITDNLHPCAHEILEQRGRVDDRAGISQDTLREVINEYDAVIVRGRTRISSEILNVAPDLQVIGRAGVGVDNIDLGAAQAQGVIVVNAPTATTLAVAEHTIGLMLALARAIPHADAGMKRGQWLKKELRGVELSGKTLGLVGMGRIGSEVAGRAAALGMQVLGHDPLISLEEIRARGAEPTTLADLFARSDFISLHVPLTPETRKMIDGQTLAGMKRGVRLICAARGGVIDETALLAALESGQVAGAALDVFEEEPPGLTALVAHPKVVATPHIGGQTAGAQERAARDIAEEVLAALDGQELRWQVV